MRIIGGKYKGRRIAMPQEIRPTKDNVREAIFNVISVHVKGARVLDLFAGSGAFGIEALSREASSVVLIDNSKSCIDTISKNIDNLDDTEAQERARILKRDVHVGIKALSGAKEKFDIVFLDPPYYKNRIRKCLKNISIYDILAHSGLVIVEHFKKDVVPEEIEPLMLKRQLPYGDTLISIYKSSKF